MIKDINNIDPKLLEEDDRIVAYLKGQMTVEEEQQFMKDLENNPDLNLILNEAPEMWEAGTLPLTQIAGLTPAIDYLEKHRPNLYLIKYAYDELVKNPKMKILTTRDAAILSFVVDGMHPLDVGALIGANNICVRAGNMCAAWIHARMGIPGSIRISVGSQNTIDDINKAIDVINKIVK